jgi:hypothetical protein
MKKTKKNYIVQVNLKGTWVRSENRNTRGVYTKEGATRRAKAETKSYELQGDYTMKYRTKEIK